MVVAPAQRLLPQVEPEDFPVAAAAAAAVRLTLVRLVLVVPVLAAS